MAGIGGATGDVAGIGGATGDVAGIVGGATGDVAGIVGGAPGGIRRYDLIYPARSFVVRSEDSGFLTYTSSFSINVFNARLYSLAPSNPPLSMSSRFDVFSRSRPYNGCVLKSMGSTIKISTPGNSMLSSNFETLPFLRTRSNANAYA